MVVSVSELVFKVDYPSHTRIKEVGGGESLF